MEKFADWQDAAAEAEAEQRDDAIAEIRRQLANSAEQTYTHCQWCGDPTENGEEHCCVECKADAERFKAAERRAGR